MKYSESVHEGRMPLTSFMYMDMIHQFLIQWKTHWVVSKQQSIYFKNQGEFYLLVTSPKDECSTMEWIVWFLSSAHRDCHSWDVSTLPRWSKFGREVTAGTISKPSWAVVHLLTFGAPFVDGCRRIQHHECRAWWPHPAGKKQHSTVWWDWTHTPTVAVAGAGGSSFLRWHQQCGAPDIHKLPCSGLNLAPWLKYESQTTCVMTRLTPLCQVSVFRGFKTGDRTIVNDGSPTNSSRPARDSGII